MPPTEPPAEPSPEAPAHQTPLPLRSQLGAWCLIPLALAPALAAAHEPLTQLDPPVGVTLRWLTTASENPVRTAIGIGLLWYALRGWPAPSGGGN